MELQNRTLSPPAPNARTGDAVQEKPRERGLERVDVRPVLHRLHGMVGKPWSDVLDKINRLDGMRYEVTRAAYLRCVGESVADAERVGLEMPFYVDEDGRLTRREEAGAEKVAEPVVLSAEIEAFLDRRVIGIRGTVLVWFVRTGRSYQVPNGTDPETGKPTHKSIDYFRQDRPLNKKEILAFKGFGTMIGEALVAMAPAAPPSAN